MRVSSLVQVTGLVSIHALRVEGDDLLARGSACAYGFYPRPPGGGRQGHQPPHRGPRKRFYPRPPGGGRPTGLPGIPVASGVSIHALRVEGDDTYSMPPTRRSSSFYPRPPGGGRHRFTRHPCRLWSFYPRPPGGGRPRRGHLQTQRHQVSIHALRVEGDVPSFKPSLKIPGFYPRPPGGGRPQLRQKQHIDTMFLSTPSGWRATW